MVNLLKETQQKIKDFGLNTDDIVFIGSIETGHSCSWEEYEKLADFNYDNGYGGNEVPLDLKIFFNDCSVMYRGEYDGAEWWEVIKSFKQIEEKKEIKLLRCSSFKWCDQ